MIKKDKIQNDSGFHDPADRLINAIKVYLQTEHGYVPTKKEIEKEAANIIRSRL